MYLLDTNVVSERCCQVTNWTGNVSTPSSFYL
ncbi:Uncharacterised protein [Legionella feeleii]|uniref:Uncharacterized protein n=1 Tax=Legionella feeleii TaxID=453 RepID=A0A2X1QMX8_9GAMM|nr:Uncharacterised protein [Legionella feeleii]